MIDYIGFELQVHGLELKTNKEIDELKAKIELAVRQLHPSLITNDEISVDIIEYAGNLEEPMGEQK